jgi:effector-binding domain-containing protein
MSYDCELLKGSPQPTLSIRTTTPVQNLPQELGKAFGAIAQYLGALGEQPAGAPYVAYFNMDMDNLEIEIGFPVSKVLPDKEDIQSAEIPGGKSARCLYTGPYNQIEPAYNALTEWIKENGFEVTGVAYEFYLNDPGEVAPEELMTQIVFPLKES